MEQQVNALRGFLAFVKSKETEENAEGGLDGEFLVSLLSVTCDLRDW